ncbi:MAG: thioredoxin [Solobacterium sp.]|nr:thioredoxin [Solobacterium sp.]
MDIIKSKDEYDALLKNNSAVFVDFFATWCGPCKMVSPIVEKLAAVNTDVVFVKVDVDETPDIAAQYGIMSIPTLMAFKHGEAAGTIVGFRPEPEIQKLVDAAK